MNESSEGPRWEPGTLRTTELERILTDALADLWADAYRRDQLPGGRLRIFRRTVESALYSATGQELWITRENGRG